MIKLLKSGSWALEGVNVVEMVEGVERSFGPAEDFKLVAAGWADWVSTKVINAAIEADNLAFEAKRRAKK